MPSWAGLWDNQHGQPYALTGEPGSAMRGIARLMAPEALKGQSAIGVALTGAAVGASVTATVAQVKPQQADSFNIGGLVPIVQTSQLPPTKTVTATGDETTLDAQLNPTWAPNPYPVEKSGNSGGGILGTINK